MSEWTSFADLNLTDVDVRGGSAILEPGNYSCQLTSAEIVKTKSGKGRQLKVEFRDESGGGSITDWLNIQNESDIAQKIGREKLKAILEFGGHENPNKPGDISTLTGLRVGVAVGMSKERKDPRTGTVYGPKREVKQYFKANGAIPPTSSGVSSSPDDDSHLFNDELNFA